jgi:hypothetical protein
VTFFCGEFLSFCEKEFKKKNSVTDSLLKKSPKNKKNCQNSSQLPTV